MPADKYGFAPTEGEFDGVRTFRMQVKHLAATNYILAAAALGQDPPADAGDEAGPEAVSAKVVECRAFWTHPQSFTAPLAGLRPGFPPTRPGATLDIRQAS
jgi:hypothetical protein